MSQGTPPTPPPVSGAQEPPATQPASTQPSPPEPPVSGAQQEPREVPSGVPSIPEQAAQRAAISGTVSQLALKAGAEYKPLEAPEYFKQSIIRLATGEPDPLLEPLEAMKTSLAKIAQKYGQLSPELAQLAVKVASNEPSVRVDLASRLQDLQSAMRAEDIQSRLIRERHMATSVLGIGEAVGRLVESGYVSPDVASALFVKAVERMGGPLESSIRDTVAANVVANYAQVADQVVSAAQNGESLAKALALSADEAERAAINYQRRLFGMNQVAHMAGPEGRLQTAIEKFRALPPERRTTKEFITTLADELFSQESASALKSFISSDNIGDTAKKLRGKYSPAWLQGEIDGLLQVILPAIRRDGLIDDAQLTDAVLRLTAVKAGAGLLAQEAADFSAITTAAALTNNGHYYANMFADSVGNATPGPRAAMFVLGKGLAKAARFQAANPSQGPASALRPINIAGELGAISSMLEAHREGIGTRKESVRDVVGQLSQSLPQVDERLIQQVVEEAKRKAQSAQQEQPKPQQGQGQPQSQQPQSQQQPQPQAPQPQAPQPGGP